MSRADIIISMYHSYILACEVDTYFTAAEKQNMNSIFELYSDDNDIIVGV